MHSGLGVCMCVCVVTWPAFIAAGITWPLVIWITQWHLHQKAMVFTKLGGPGHALLSDLNLQPVTV